MLDLDYSEDSTAEVDMNIVMTGLGEFTELQGTAEGATFGRAALDQLIALGEAGIAHIIEAQRAVLATPPAPRALDPR
jgi:ribonuclease PH